MRVVESIFLCTVAANLDSNHTALTVKSEEKV